MVVLTIDEIVNFTVLSIRLIIFVNPSIYFDNKEAAGCEKVMDSLIACMEKVD